MNMNDEYFKLTELPAARLAEARAKEAYRRSSWSYKRGKVEHDRLESLAAEIEMRREYRRELEHIATAYIEQQPTIIKDILHYRYVDWHEAQRQNTWIEVGRKTGHSADYCSHADKKHWQQVQKRRQLDEKTQIEQRRTDH